MTNYETIRRDPLAHLDYFTEWGGSAWTRLVKIGLVDYLGGNFEGQRVLEIGARYGRMSCLFGLLGARVTGIDIHAECLEIARVEAQKLGVESRVEFRQYTGEFTELSGQHFDVVFAKSVFFLFGDLRRVLPDVDKLLNEKGKVVFIENGLGGRVVQFARKVRHAGGWDYSRAHFFTNERLKVTRAVFNIEKVVTTRLPPVYLMCGTKKDPESVSHR